MEGMQLGSLSDVPTKLATTRSIKKQSFPEEPSFDCLEPFQPLLANTNSFVVTENKRKLHLEASWRVFQKETSFQLVGTWTIGRKRSIIRSLFRKLSLLINTIKQ